MKTSARIFSKIQARIHSEEFKKKYRLSQKAFIRKCALSFSFLVVFIINQIKRSNASEINQTVYFLNNVKIFTKSALSKARLKLSPDAFIELNEILIDEFYEKKSNHKLFLNFNVFVIDGSKIQLPEGNHLEEKFGSSSNQNGPNMNMAQCSQLVDAINGLIINSLIYQNKKSERDLADIHIHEFLKKREKIKNLWNTIILFDRGYPSLSLILKLFHNRIDFLMRSSVAFLKEIKDFVNSGRKDGIIEIDTKRLHEKEREKLLKECQGIIINKKIKIRVIVVVLKTGEKEILLTSLFDEKKYKYKKFKEFYSLRWGAETIYGFEKIRWELENFSGKSSISIKQDFYASILNFNMTVVLALEAKKELDQSGEVKHRKYKYEINYSIALSYMKNKFMSALLNISTNPNDFCFEVKTLMKKNLEPIRFGRSFPHKRKHKGKRFPTNTRKII